jgi:uncharacterized protein YbjT (DUF2867 family)
LKLQLRESESQEQFEMNLVVLGATGRTGRLVAEQALAAGHTVTALVRSPQKLAIIDPNLRVIAGAATDVAAVTRALEGADVVISTLGGTGSVITDSTSAIVEAAQKAGIRRVLVLSSFFVERDSLNAVSRLLTGLAMGSMIRDKTAGEQLLRESGLDWTIVYASLLRDGPANGSVAVLPEGARRGMAQRIARADVAAWMVETARTGQHSRRSVGITG